MAFALAACAGRFGAPSGPELRLVVAPDVRWQVEGPHAVTLVLENSGSAPLAIAEPAAAGAVVAVRAPGEAAPLCGREAAEPDRIVRLVRLAPGERREVHVPLDGCAPEPGEYRYEIAYDLPRVPGAARWGRLGPEHGRVVVGRSAGTVELPASRRAVSPPVAGETPGVPPLAEPRARARATPLGPAALACVDRELARRGLNAYGDPSGTTYPDGPPVLGSDLERVRSVAARYPDLATSCGVAP